MKFFRLLIVVMVVFGLALCLPQYAISQESSEEAEEEPAPLPGITSVDFSTDTIYKGRNLRGLSYVTESRNSHLKVIESLRTSHDKVIIVGEIRGSVHFKNETAYAGVDHNTIFVGMMDDVGYLYFHNTMPVEGDLSIGGIEVRQSASGQYIVDVLYTEHVDDDNWNVWHTGFFSNGEAWGRTLFSGQGNGRVTTVENGRLAVSFRGSLIDAASGVVYNAPQDRTRAIVFDYVSSSTPVKLRMFTGDRLRVQKILDDGTDLVAVAGDYGGYYGNRTTHHADINNVFTVHKKPNGKWTTKFYTPPADSHATVVSDAEIENNTLRIYVKNYTNLSLSFVTTSEVERGDLKYRGNLIVKKEGKTVGFSRKYLEDEFPLNKASATSGNIALFNAEMGDLYSYEEMIADIEVPRCKDQQCHAVGVGEGCDLANSGSCLPEDPGGNYAFHKRCNLFYENDPSYPKCYEGATGKVCNEPEDCEDLHGVCHDQACVDISMMPTPPPGGYTFCMSDEDCPKKHCKLLPDGQYECAEDGDLGECEIDSECYEGRTWCGFVTAGSAIMMDCTEGGTGHACSGPDECSNPLIPRTPKKACSIDTWGYSPLPQAKGHVCDWTERTEHRKLCPSGNPWDCVEGVLKRCKRIGLNEFQCTVEGDGKECVPGEEDECFDKEPGKYCNLGSDGKMSCVEGGNKESDCEIDDDCKDLMWCGLGVVNNITCNQSGSYHECENILDCDDGYEPTLRCEVWDMKGDFPDPRLEGSFPFPLGVGLDLVGLGLPAPFSNITIQTETPYAGGGDRFLTTKRRFHIFCVIEF